ncbi:hypothetical protein ANN_24514 [Periplaneta americana]|uniref:DUF4817 domain-containing protein n=1 Tax=Periplaneta americana TaxID=6978 RepID=A0ABQ8S3L0_PERAM|nr:hypothetical protein ANN_24514 [Periplaneta americana]
MADTSNYSTEERVIASCWVHERNQRGKTIAEVRADFQARFQRDPPPKQTLLRWEHKFFATGCVKDKERSGRPSTRETCRLIKESVQRSPQK